MEILSKEHEKTIQEWMGSDLKTIKEFMDFKAWLIKMVEKYSFNKEKRDIYNSLLDSTNLSLKQQKTDFKKNYGETYKLLSK